MKKVLVLCIDRDDDLGKKARIKGPFIGEEACLKAAESLALADPTESDINAIYMAIKVYKEMKKNGEHVEVATLAGHSSRGYLADKRVAEQLEKLLNKYKFTDIVFVSDGADDEQLLPLLQSRAKVSSVYTVIVKQAKELEKSYYVIKELLRDPHFARLAFGLPGVVLAIYGVVNLLGIQHISINLILGLVGIYLILKGFGIEDALVGAFNTFKRTTSIERASFPLYLASFFILLLAIWAGVDNVAIIEKNIAQNITIEAGNSIIISVASFFNGFIGLFTIALVLFFAGRIGDMYYKKEYHRIRKYARSIVSMIAFYIIFDQITRFALYWTNAIQSGPTFSDLIVSVGISFLVTVVGFVVVSYIYAKKYVSKRIKKGLEVKDIDGKAIGKVIAVDYKNQSFAYSHEKERVVVGFNKVVVIRDNAVVIF